MIIGDSKPSIPRTINLLYYTFEATVVGPMTFFDTFFKMPWACKRHNRAPLMKEREKFLLHELEIGRKNVGVQQRACLLLQINRTLGFSRRMRGITHAELDRT